MNRTQRLSTEGTLLAIRAIPRSPESFGIRIGVGLSVLREGDPVPLSS